jgi:hypothetical protein
MTSASVGAAAECLNTAAVAVRVCAVTMNGSSGAVGSWTTATPYGLFAVPRFVADEMPWALAGPKV